MAPARGQGGFSLVEALVGLALLGLALLLSLSILLGMPRAIARLDAQREADRAIEAVLEAVRAGALPLAPGSVVAPVPQEPGAAARGLTLRLAVEPADAADLWAVTVRARYLAGGALRERTAETLVWRP